MKGEIFEVINIDDGRDRKRGRGRNLGKKRDRKEEEEEIWEFESPMKWVGSMGHIILPISFGPIH